MPGQPDVPLLIITGVALRAKLHLGHSRKLGVAAPLLQDRLCNHVRNQIYNWISPSSEHLAAHVLGLLIS